MKAGACIPTPTVAAAPYSSAGKGTAAWKRRQAAGAFLRAFAQWDWIATLTFPYPVMSRNQAIARLRAWLDALARAVGDRVCAAYGIEADVAGELHVHVVVAFPANAKRPTLTEGDSLWRARNGHARIRIFDPKLGGEWYVCKSDKDWDVMYGRPSKHWLRSPGVR